METKNNKPLTIVFVVMIVLFLLFTGGALSVTLSDGVMMGNSAMSGNSSTAGSVWRSGISWMWIPSVLFLALSILLGWVIFAKKEVKKIQANFNI